MRLGHTGCHPGKKVLIILRDGSQMIGKFKDRTKKHVFLMDGRKIFKGDIRVFSFYNPRIANLQTH